jgi:hypothetical protein
MATYRDCQSLSDETEQVEFEFAIRGERNASGNHANDREQFLTWFLNAGYPGNEQDCYWRESLYGN